MKQFETKEDGDKVVVLNDRWKIVFHKREELPRREGGVGEIGGVDFGNIRIVIARWPTENGKNLNYLTWHRASKAWSGRMNGSVSVPATLTLHRYRVDDILGKDIAWGRLSKDVVLRRAGDLAELTDIPAEVWRWVVISGDLRKYTAAISKLK